MEVLPRVSVNFVIGSLTGVVLYAARIRLDRQRPFNRLYLASCMVLIAMIALETLTCFINGRAEAMLRLLSNAAHIILFSMPPILGLCWFQIGKFFSMPESTNLTRPTFFQMIPALISTVLSFLSPFYHFYFMIDELGVYRRGPLFYVALGIPFLYLTAGFVRTFLQRDQLDKQGSRFLFLFFLFPFMGGLIQALAYGALLLWGCAACSLVILYIYLNERMIQIDGLTGAWTRSSFTHYLSRKLSSNSGARFGLIFLDANDFSEINDRYGHIEGDQALKDIVAIVKRVLPKGDSIARLGGDEFIIYSKTADIRELRALTSAIEAAFAAYNRDSGRPYKLSLSYGADIFRQSADMDVEHVLRQVDRLMYEDKRARQ